MRALEKQIKVLDKAIEQQFQIIPNTLTSVPGIGKVQLVHCFKAFHESDSGGAGVGDVLILSHTGAFEEQVIGKVLLLPHQVLYNVKSGPGEGLQGFVAVIALMERFETVDELAYVDLDHLTDFIAESGRGRFADPAEKAKAIQAAAKTDWCCVQTRPAYLATDA